MSRKRSNKQHLEYIFVPTGNQVVKATGVLSASGNAVNLAAGQLGIMSADHGSATRPWGTFLQAGDTATTADAIKIVMGTAYSADTTASDGWGIKRPFMESCILRSKNVRSFAATVVRIATFDSSSFTGFNAPEDLTNYKMYVELRSVRNDRNFGKNVQTLPVTYTTPAYSDIATITDTTTHLLGQMLAKINMNSKVLASSPNWLSRGNFPVIAFAMNVDGGDGVTLEEIECGTVIPVMTTTRAGVEYTANFVADQDFVETVQEWLTHADTPYSGASTIELIDTTIDGTDDGSVYDAFIIMGTNQDVAVAYDDIYSKKVRVDVQLGDGFRVLPLFTSVKLSDAFDGQGQGRGWRIRYDERAFGQRYINQLTGFKDNFIELPLSNLDESKTYTAHIIDVYDDEETLTGNPQTQKRVVILLETNCTCFPYSETVFDLTGSVEEDTYVFNGVTYEDDGDDDGVTGDNVAFDGTAAGLAVAINATETGVRATLTGANEVTIWPCEHVAYTTAANLDSILKVWLASTELSSITKDSEFSTNYFALEAPDVTP